MDANNTTIRFFGSTACLFDKGDDTPSFLINDKYLFDTGFSLISNLKNADVDPTSIKYLFFTHMHHDHYMALPQLLFYFLQTGKKLEELTIIGPSADVERVTKNAMEFLEAKKCWKTEGPVVIPLDDFGTYETEDMYFETIPAIHGVQAFSYRITDKRNGKVICATGDTALNPNLEIFFSGCDTLIHEVSLGMSNNPLGGKNPHGHSAVCEAVNLAKNTGAKRLFFVHLSRLLKEQVYEYCKENNLTCEYSFPNLLEEYRV